MILEAQEIFTNTSMQDEPTDFQALYRKRAQQPAASQRMYVWHPLSGYYVVDVMASGEVAIAEAEGELGFPGDQVVFLAHRGMRWPDPDEESAVWRGVFSPTYRRKVLLEKRVKIQTAKLPRLQPQITLDLQRLSREEDD